MGEQLDLFGRPPPPPPSPPAPPAPLATRLTRPTVTLEPEMLQRILDAAARRMRNAIGATRRVTPKFNDHQMDSLGLIGEVSQSRYLHTPMCWNLDGADTGHDLVLADGTTAGCKHVHRRWGNLNVEPRPDDEPPEYLRDARSDRLLLSVGPCTQQCVCKALLAGELPLIVTLVGWVWTRDFRRFYKTKDWGYGLRYYLRPEQLRPFQTLPQGPPPPAEQQAAMRAAALGAPDDWRMPR